MRCKFLILGVCATVILAALPSTAVASSAKLGDFYVAIGDGYALGYLTADLPADPQCQASDAPSYVCGFYRYLRQINPNLTVQNYGEQNADSCELSGAGHRCFETTPVADPLDGAVGFIEQHEGQVSPITLSLGGSDLLPLLPAALTDPVGTAAQLPGVLTRFQANLTLILARLRAAAGPDAEIIVTTQVNPLDGIPSPPLPSGIPDLAANAIGALNTAIQTAAAAEGAKVADAATAFHTYPGGPAPLTWAATSLAAGDPSKVNPYPTPDGYRVIAQTIIKASGYVAPITLTSGLKRKSVKTGKSESVRGTASLDSTLKVTVAPPHGKHRSISGSVGATGDFSLSFKVGRARGKGWVRVCVLDLLGQSKCSGKLTFTVK